MSERFSTPGGEASGQFGAPRPVTLTELLTVPRRRWRWVLAFAAFGLLAVVGYLTVLPASYTATSVVTVRAVVTDPFSYPGPGADRAVNMNVEQGIATGTRVIKAVAAKTGSDAPEVRDALDVEIPTGGQVLRFSYTSDDAGRSVTAANTAAATYLDTREAGYRKQRDDQLASYDKSLDTLDKKAKAARDEQGGGWNGDSGDGDGTLRSINDRITQLTEERARIAAVDLAPGTVTRPAARPVPSDHDHPLWYLLAGVVGGALLGALAGYARESADRRVRRGADAVDAAQAPLLGEVRRAGRVSARQRRADVDYVAIAVRRLAAEAAPVLLASPGADDGRADLSADVAVALAAMGEHVYLGDVRGSGDELRARVLAGAAGHPPAADNEPPARDDRRVGVPAASQATDESLTETVQMQAVTLAPVGADGPGANGTRRGDRSARGAVRTAGQRRGVITGGARGADVLARLPMPVTRIGTGSVCVGPADGAPADVLVVLDAPPLDRDARGAVDADGGAAVLVALQDRTRQADLRRAADRLRTSGATAAGVVLIGGGRG